MSKQEKHNAYMREKIMCDDCGKYYSRVNELRHLNSFTHRKNAARISGNKNVIFVEKKKY